MCTFVMVVVVVFSLWKNEDDDMNISRCRAGTVGISKMFRRRRSAMLVPIDHSSFHTPHKFYFGIYQNIFGTIQIYVRRTGTASNNNKQKVDPSPFP